MQSATQQIKEIMFNNPGKIYINKDFEHIANKNTIASILSKLNKQEQIKRLITGMYVKPIYSEFLKASGNPFPSKVAEKISQKHGWTIAPGGEVTLNYTGVSTQIPNSYMYISDGPSRIYEYQGWKITFIHRNKKYITSRSEEFAILIEAIKRLGKRSINNKRIIRQLASFAQNVKEDLARETKTFENWIRNVLLEIKEINDNR
ncbi:DUF6088 family protein [Mycoplasmopsis citelli]|uniref:Uncharacterized protein n=1 Tax=Mycoplasmopsis citelli TaxID=171281 RepID=A0A449B0X5_9BACT|nr:DUF6088 family protein [Mycoplasmopsis citelli]UUD36577.1 DUF6088 family protein [Mycoplasmopsis citelli]VEU74213.1 Uncharacterised protein [Mycoplasmopsis citelli]